MKKLLILIGCGLLVGCDYTVPLVKSPSLAIDRSVLGLWQRSTENGQTEQLLVLPLDAREYLVSYPSASKDGLFARACLARVADRTLVQLKWLGNAQAELPGDNRLFQFVSYSVTGNRLTLRLLNTDVVPKSVASSDELAQAITAHGDNPNLFKQAIVFTKVKP